MKSVVGRGSTFRIFFPAAAPAVPSSTALKEKESRGGSETILLVEDEAAVRKSASLLLRRSGYQVVEANNGIEALIKWDELQGRVDLLLTDMVMPERMTGLEVAEILQQRKSDLKVIIWSGYTVDAERQRVAAKRGMVYLSKPVKPAELLTGIRQCLDKT